jgi:TetR/AcrR family transcriptional repressor of lmrAB and yxaGH operons
MVQAAGRLLRRQGYAATGWRQVVAESQAPWGSQAHHFPGGKEQLAVDALALAGSRYRELLAASLAETHPADMVVGWAAAAAGQLAASGWADGCPVATVALEKAHESVALGVACHDALQSWIVTIAEAVEARGLSAADAASIGTAVVAGIEGGLLLARAARSAEPLQTTAAELAGWLRTRVP